MKYIAYSLLLLPVFVHAQTAQTFITNFTNWLGDVVIPFLVGIAFVIFVFNAIRYFVAGAADKDAREKARALATYSVLAFVLLVTFWGIVTMLSSSIGLEGGSQPTSDYQQRDDRTPPYCPPEGGPC